MKKKIRLILVTMTVFILLFGSYLFFRGDSENVVRISPSTVVKEDGLYKLGKDIVFSTGDGNMTLVTSKDNAALIDTGYTEEDAINIKNYLEKNNLKLKNIIITHMHSDHTGNLESFKTDGVQVYTPYDVKDGDIITMGDKTFKILNTPGHTDENSHISIELVKEHILVAGDVVITNSIPALGGSVTDMVTTLDLIKKNSYNVILPGHGNIINSQQAIEQNLEYINKARELVEKLIKDGGTESDLENIKLEDCVSDTSYITPENIQQLHIFDLNNIYFQMEQG